MSITITLPWPDKALSPNAGKRSMYPAIRARKAYRELAGWEWAAETEGFIAPPVVADITFTYTMKRKFDEDNHLAMLKPVWDGAQDAGVIVGDHAVVFSICVVMFVYGTERVVTVSLREGR